MRGILLFQQQEKNITEMDSLSFSQLFFLYQNVSAPAKYRIFQNLVAKQVILGLARKLRAVQRRRFMLFFYFAMLSSLCLINDLPHERQTPHVFWQRIRMYKYLRLRLILHILYLLHLRELSLHSAGVICKN